MRHSLRTPLRQKRASLSLSINAIVIIVLAMTLLGLGLGFIRGLFKNITETTGTVQEQVKQQVLDDLRTGDKKLSFSTNSLTMESSGAQTVTIGVRNSKPNAAPMHFIVFVETLQYKSQSGVKVTCTRDNVAEGMNMEADEEPTYTCKEVTPPPPQSGESATTGDVERSDTEIDNIQFFYDRGGIEGYTLTADNAEVFPIRITSSSGTKGTFLVKISVLEDIDTNGVDTRDHVYGAAADNEIYAEKSFFITVA